MTCVAREDASLDKPSYYKLPQNTIINYFPQFISGFPAQNHTYESDSPQIYAIQRFLSFHTFVPHRSIGLPAHAFTQYLLKPQIYPGIVPIVLISASDPTVRCHIVINVNDHFRHNRIPGPVVPAITATSTLTVPSSDTRRQRYIQSPKHGNTMGVHLR